MAMTVLSHSSALNPGADLWVLPDHLNSQWTPKLDWYLNFQIIRDSRKPRTQISNALAEIIQQTEFDLPRIPFDTNAGLLIPADKTLPARWVFTQAFNNADDWALSIHKTWMSLGQPSLKIFLPTGLTAGQFSEHWQKVAVTGELSVVLD